MAQKRSRPRRNLLAKSVDMRYGFPGDLLEGWEARPLSANEYEIVRHNGTTRIVKMGETIQVRERGAVEPQRSTVNVSESGVLMIGSKSVLIGRNLKHGFQARAAGGSHSYLLLDDKLRQLGRVTIGQEVDGKPVSLVAKHLLQIGEEIFPIVPKMYEVTLLVLQKPYEGGYLSYINVIEKGNILNREDGTMGSLVPPKNEGEPARFVESFKGKMVTTALFWPDERGRMLKYHSRTAEDALTQLAAEEEANNARSVAIEAGIAPEDYAEFVSAQNKVDQMERAWIKKGMALITGAEIFKPHDIRDMLSEPGYGM